MHWLPVSLCVLLAAGVLPAGALGQQPAQLQRLSKDPSSSSSSPPARPAPGWYYRGNVAAANQPGPGAGAQAGADDAARHSQVRQMSALQYAESPRGPRQRSERRTLFNWDLTPASVMVSTLPRGPWRRPAQPPAYSGPAAPLQLGPIEKPRPATAAEPRLESPGHYRTPANVHRPEEPHVGSAHWRSASRTEPEEPGPHRAPGHTSMGMHALLHNRAHHHWRPPQRAPGGGVSQLHALHNRNRDSNRIAVHAVRPEPPQPPRVRGHAPDTESSNEIHPLHTGASVGLADRRWERQRRPHYPYWLGADSQTRRVVGTMTTEGPGMSAGHRHGLDFLPGGDRDGRPRGPKWWERQRLRMERRRQQKERRKLGLPPLPVVEPPMVWKGQFHDYSNRPLALTTTSAPMTPTAGVPHPALNEGWVRITNPSPEIASRFNLPLIPSATTKPQTYRQDHGFEDHGLGVSFGESPRLHQHVTTPRSVPTTVRPKPESFTSIYHRIPGRLTNTEYRVDGQQRGRQHGTIVVHQISPMPRKSTTTTTTTSTTPPTTTENPPTTTTTVTPAHIPYPPTSPTPAVLTTESPAHGPGEHTSEEEQRAGPPQTPQVNLSPHKEIIDNNVLTAQESDGAHENASEELQLELQRGRLEAERLEQERLGQARLEQVRLEQVRLEQERLEQERLEQVRLEQARLEQMRLEQERLEQERLEQERLEQERRKQVRLEQERVEQERLEQERREQERLEQERLEQERLEQERLEQERLEQERLEQERLQQERLEQERGEQERLEQERLEQERLRAEAIARAEEAQRKEEERLKQDSISREKAERIETEKIRLETAAKEMEESLRKEALEKEETERREQEHVKLEALEREELQRKEQQKIKQEEENVAREKLRKEEERIRLQTEQELKNIEDVRREENAEEEQLLEERRQAERREQERIEELRREEERLEEERRLEERKEEERRAEERRQEEKRVEEKRKKEEMERLRLEEERKEEERLRKEREEEERVEAERRAEERLLEEKRLEERRLELKRELERRLEERRQAEKRQQELQEEERRELERRAEERRLAERREQERREEERLEEERRDEERRREEQRQALLRIEARAEEERREAARKEQQRLEEERLAAERAEEERRREQQVLLQQQLQQQQERERMEKERQEQERQRLKKEREEAEETENEDGEDDEDVDDDDDNESRADSEDGELDGKHEKQGEDRSGEEDDRDENGDIGSNSEDNSIPSTATGAKLSEDVGKRKSLREGEDDDNDNEEDGDEEGRGKEDDSATSSHGPAAGVPVEAKSSVPTRKKEEVEPTSAEEDGSEEDVERQDPSGEGKAGVREAGSAESGRTEANGTHTVNPKGEKEAETNQVQTEEPDGQVQRGESDESPHQHAHGSSAEPEEEADEENGSDDEGEDEEDKDHNSSEKDSVAAPATPSAGRRAEDGENSNSGTSQEDSEESKPDLSCSDEAPDVQDAKIRYVRTGAAAEAHYECFGGYELIGEARLVCSRGRWVGSVPTCQPVDPCLEDRGGCDHICTNVGGEAECSCRKGFRLEGDFCVDVDECEANAGRGPCQDSCENLEGGYRCSCGGVAGSKLAADNHTCEDIDECAVDNNGCSHNCLNTQGSAFCLCPDGMVLHSDWKSCVEMNQEDKRLSKDDKSKDEKRDESDAEEEEEVGGREEDSEGDGEEGEEEDGGDEEDEGGEDDYVDDQPLQTMPKMDFPWLKCPRDVISELPPGRDTVKIVLSKPKLGPGITWKRDVAADPPWAKGRHADLSVGEHVLTFRAKDPITRRKASCILVVSVKASEPPLIAGCPKSVRAKVKGRKRSAAVTWSEPTVDDNVGVVRFHRSRDPGSRFPIGKTLVTYEASDLAGHTSTCSFLVDVRGPAT